MDNHLLALYKNYNFPVIITGASNVYRPSAALQNNPKGNITLPKEKKLCLHDKRAIKKIIYLY